MASRIGVHDEGAVWFLHWAGEDDCTKFDGPESGCAEIRNRQVEMELLRRAIWPVWREIRRCTLEGQLERQITNVHLTPLRITEIHLPLQKVCVEGRKS